MSCEIIMLPVVTTLAPNAIDPSVRDVAHRIRTGRIDADEMRTLFAQSGFRDWFARRGFEIHKRAVLGSPVSGRSGD